MSWKNLCPIPICYIQQIKNMFKLIDVKLEDQWAESVSLTFHSVLRKLYTEPSIGASKFRFIQLFGLRTEDVQKSTILNQKQELPVAAMFVYESGRIEQF